MSSSVNPTTLLRRIKRKIGASHFPIPLSDEDILDVIYEETLYTFSTYYPHIEHLKINIKSDLAHKGIYYIESGDLEIISVSRMYRGMGYISGTYLPRNTNPFDLQLNADIRSMVENPDTFKFLPPNRIEVYPKYIDVTDMLLEVKCIHPIHLNTIKLSMRDPFYELAELDVMISLHKILRNYSNVNTAFGSIELRLEDFEAAEDKRRELLERWRKNFIKEGTRKRIWIS